VTRAHPRPDLDPSTTRPVDGAAEEAARSTGTGDGRMHPKAPGSTQSLADRVAVVYAA
jgi:hypothetical protein